jgi:hypothetical protein
MDINIGISRDKAREFVADLTAALEKDAEPFVAKLYGRPNGAEDDKDGSGEVNLMISNDDMEREEVSEEVLVSFDPR